MIFSISDCLSQAKKINAVTFSELNIWERTHIEEWVRTNPEILGEELLILTTEFSAFDKSQDRLDVLALDLNGNLVVVELKRDAVGGHADLQAIRYAAMVSTMTVEKLLPYYIQYRKKFDSEDLSLADARQILDDFVEATDWELSTKPRILLCSQGFSPAITATVLWLRECSIDIGCVRITPYQVEGKVIIVPTVIIPLPEASEYLVEIKMKEEEQAQSNSMSKKPKTMKVLLENNLLKEGDRVFLRNALPSYLKFDANDPRFHGTITGKGGQSNAILWDKDGSETSLSAAARAVFDDAHPNKKYPGGVSGTWHWTNQDNVPLVKMADEFLATQIPKS